jgi:phenylpyruvate tautomerase PptA (4-oxalocrotonate tautomerase family)
MPFYTVTAPENSITADQKRALAACAADRYHDAHRLAEAVLRPPNR